MTLIQVVFIIVLLSLTAETKQSSARDENEGETSKNLRRQRNISKRRKHLIDDSNKLVAGAVSISYPISIFIGNTTPLEEYINWRSPAKFNQNIFAKSEVLKSWNDLSKAQDQEDVWLYENWFYGLEKGIIMESGALDGMLFSTSYMYETFANWTAIHVEADPENYSKLRNNRPNAININAALCSESRPLHYSSEGVVPVRGFIEFMTESFIKKWHGRVYNNKTRIEDLPTVHCLPVQKLLQELHITHVDIWILDVEGAEESVLKGTDFEAVRFNAVAMECDEHDVTKNSRKTSILEAHGFKCSLVERNCMCRHKDFRPSSRKTKSLLRKYDGNKWSKTYVNKGAQE